MARFGFRRRGRVGRRRSRSRGRRRRSRFYNVSRGGIRL